MIRKTFFIPSVFIILIAAFTAVGAARAGDYIVGEEDILKIAVYDHPDLTTVARVSGNGLITLPLIGDVQVMGLTTSQIAQKVAKLLSDGFIVDPHVSVFIEEFKSKKVTIIGQISKPGVYVLSGRTTLLELISKAGGITKEAADKAIIKRKSAADSKTENSITVDLKKLVEQSDSAEDIQVLDSDNIYIPKASVFYVTGEVRKPDAYRYEEGLTVIKAITMAGGFSEKASIGRVRVIRKIEGKEKVYERTDMDMQVLPDDIIIVPESFF